MAKPLVFFFFKQNTLLCRIKNFDSDLNGHHNPLYVTSKNEKKKNKTKFSRALNEFNNEKHINNR